MKKSILSLCLAISLVSSNAHAILLGGMIAGLFHNEDEIHCWGTAEWAACLILLPFCIFEKDMKGGSFNVSDLTKNGYSPAEAADIMKNQKALVEKLHAQKLRFSIDARDSRDSLKLQILSVHPQASATYLDFVANQAGL